LRDSLAFIDHSKRHQAVAYELEFVIEQALVDEFGEKAAELSTQWELLTTRHPFLEEHAETRAAQFAAWTKRERREGFSGLLRSLSPMYPALYPMWARTGDAAHLVSPADYDRWKEREFPDPKW
jgi:hypothetical protein